MYFCEKCESMLKARSNKETNLKEYFCKCGAVYNLAPEKKIIKSKNKELTNLKKTIILYNNDEDLGSFIEQSCPECGNNKAYLFEMSPMHGDEDNVIRYRCTKCKFTYSDGGKIL